jgi:hypothetical protein
VGWGHVVGPLVDRDAKHAIPVSLRHAWDAAVKPDERQGGAVPGQPDPVRNLGDHAHTGETLPLPGQQQHACIAAGVVHRKGDRHAGEDHRIV